MSVNKISLDAELDVDGRNINQPFEKKNACEEAVGLESTKKCYHRCNRPERSLADYEEGDEAEQRQISSIISCLPTGSEFPSRFPSTLIQRLQPVKQ